jgi:hypothetical protein
MACKTVLAGSKQVTKLTGILIDHVIDLFAAYEGGRWRIF